MKFAISREWCAEKAKAEAGAEISAGLQVLPLYFLARKVMPSRLMTRARPLGALFTSAGAG